MKLWKVAVSIVHMLFVGICLCGCLRGVVFSSIKILLEIVDMVMDICYD